MREILFKAYIKSLKWIVPVERIDFDCKTVEVDLTAGEGSTAEYSFDEIELLEYTGLTDKNGIRIFEGDILENILGCKFVVEWEDEGRFLGFTIEKERKIIYVNRDPKAKVIGNKWDNPELLEVVK